MLGTYDFAELFTPSIFTSSFTYYCHIYDQSLFTPPTELFVDGTSFEVPENNELSELKGKPSVIAIEVDESGRSGDVSKLFAFLFGACQLILIILYGIC